MKKKNIIYRICIAPEVLPAMLFYDGEIHVKVSDGLPADVRFIAAGWEDHLFHCMYVDYIDNNSPAKKGEEVIDPEVKYVKPLYSVIPGNPRE